MSLNRSMVGNLTQQGNISIVPVTGSETAFTLKNPSNNDNWKIKVDSTNRDLIFERFNDSGVSQGNAIVIQRSTGNITTDLSISKSTAAILSIISGAATNASLNFRVSPNIDWAMGIDSGDGNRFKLYNSTSGGFSGTQHMEIGSTILAIGRSAGAVNTGANNTFIGIDAGLVNSTGQNNTMLGNGSGMANLVGNSNTYIGSNAGLNATGSNNTCIGHNTGSAASYTGSSNIIIGAGAAASLTTAVQNTIIGNIAGATNTNKQNITLLGYNSNIDNTVVGLTNASAIGNNAFVSASNSVVLGSINGVNSGTANSNVGIGTSAPSTPLHVSRSTGVASTRIESLTNDDVYIEFKQGVTPATWSIGVDHSRNRQFTITNGAAFSGGTYLQLGPVGASEITSLGYSAGFNNTTGVANTYIGANAGIANSIGNSNVYIGDLSGQGAGDSSNNTFVGADSGNSQSGGLNTFIGTACGIGSGTGTRNVCMGESCAGQLDGNNNIIIGQSAANNVAPVTVSNCVIIGQSAASTLTDKSNITLVGYNTEIDNTVVGLTNATAIGHLAYVNQSNSLVLGSVNTVNGATSNTSVGIGVTSPTAVLDVVSTASGVRIPRVTTAQRNAFAAPASGMMIFNTTTSLFQIHNGTSWGDISATNNALEVITSDTAISTSGITYFNSSGTTVPQTLECTLANPEVGTVKYVALQALSVARVRIRTTRSDYYLHRTNKWAIMVFGSKGWEINASETDSAFEPIETLTKLTLGTGATGNAEQGTAVAINYDGDIALVGGPKHNSSQGAVWIYTRNNVTGVWTQFQQLTSASSSATSEFGSSVAMSADGYYIAVGAPLHSTHGGVVMFARTGGGSTWVEIAGVGFLTPTAPLGAGARFGRSVSVEADGTSVLIGGPEDNGGIGAIWRFTIATGVEVSKTVPSDNVGNANYGTSVHAISSSYYATSGPADNSGKGAIWVLYPAIDGVEGTLTSQKIVHSKVSSINQGRTVRLSDAGDTVVWSATDSGGTSNTGELFMAKLRDNVWTYVTSREGDGTTLVAASTDDTYGTSFGLSGDASKIITAKTVLQRLTMLNIQNQRMLVESSKKDIIPPSVVGAAAFGRAIALSGNGKAVIIGGPTDDTNKGAVWVSG